MLRLLRAVAALALVPLVIFANPLSAAAATSGTLVFGLDAPGIGSTTCQIPWARTNTGISVGATSRCDGGADMTPLSCQPFEGECGSYGLVFKDATGDTCGSVALDPYDVEGNDWRSTAAGLGAGFAPIQWSSCTPVSACLSYYFEPNGTDVVACQSISIDQPEPGWEPPAEMPFGSCEWGTPQAVAWEHVFTMDTSLVKDRLRLLFYSRYPEPGDGLGLEWTLISAHGPADASTGNEYTSTDQTDNGNNPQWISDTLWKNQPEGVGGSHSPSGGQAWGVQVNTRDTDTLGAFSPERIGYTNPGKCSFWFGPKIRNGDHPEYGDDEPWAPLTPYPDVGTDPVDPVPPTTEVPTAPPDFGLPDLGSFLQGIGDAIMGLVRGLLDGLKRLFIPNTDEWGVESLQDMLREKPPFSVAAELKDQAWSFVGAYTSSGSCGILADFGPVGGESTALDCARIKNAPGLGGLYTLVSVGLVGLTAWSCFIMIQRVFQDGS